MIAQDFGVPLMSPNREFLCGCEFEIEDIKTIPPVLHNYFNIVDDHSLRNNGREFITPPSSYDDTVGLFKQLHGNLKVGVEPFSERTSIHVHVNVSNLSQKETKQLILTYALLEPLFFAFVGNSRQENIYCVPLNYTYLPTRYQKTVAQLVNEWHKYTAFNIKPIKQIGTVEFRHLYGTDKEEVFNVWLASLKTLYDFIANNPTFNVMKFLAKHSPKELAQQVVPLLMPLYKEGMLDDTVLDVLLSDGGI